MMNGVGKAESKNREMPGSTGGGDATSLVDERKQMWNVKKASRKEHLPRLLCSHDATFPSTDGKEIKTSGIQ